jgi:hypothetical protein
VRVVAIKATAGSSAGQAPAGKNVISLQMI